MTIIPLSDSFADADIELRVDYRGLKHEDAIKMNKLFNEFIAAFYEAKENVNDH